MPGTGLEGWTHFFQYVLIMTYFGPEFWLASYAPCLIGIISVSIKVCKGQRKCGIIWGNILKLIVVHIFYSINVNSNDDAFRVQWSNYVSTSRLYNVFCRIYLPDTNTLGPG